MKEEEQAEEMDPSVPPDLLELFVELDEQGLTPEDLKGFKE